ncbi:hypothetical protein FRB99_005251 [Tulasnella sp. 403]|nr:hypothetical protein FRB99_005251 [Tulasnella sp. 403]
MITRRVSLLPRFSRRSSLQWGWAYLGKRSFTATPNAFNELVNQAARSSSTREMMEIERLDNLLTRIREKTDPSHWNLISVRSPSLWSEKLHSAQMKQVKTTTSQDPTVSARSPLDPLAPRHMHESYCQVDLPFKSDPLFLEKYTNSHGGIRTGMLMEHLDSLAGSISYKHCLGPGQQLDKDINQRGFYMVTAAVDRLDMLHLLTPFNVNDLRLSGHVIYVGRSSMEVAVRMESVDSAGNPIQTMMLGRFSMVCRDAETRKSRPVGPLIIETPEEEALHAMGEAHKQKKQALQQGSLSRTPPSVSESRLLHEQFLKHGEGDVYDDIVPKDGAERVWMEDTRRESLMLMYPQSRNIHSKIFGGYLMRLAYEIGYANASLFTRTPLRFLSLDGIFFRLPVPIGSALRLMSTICHTASDEHHPAVVNVWVQANVIDSETGHERTTNDFYFTWCREEGQPLDRVVVPRTYQEAMQWLEGKRALDIGAEIRGLRRANM